MSFDDDFERPFEDIEPPEWAALREICQANVSHFAGEQDDGSIRIKSALIACLDYLGQLYPSYKEIGKIAPQFDFDSKTPGNGYRSFLVLVDKCILYTENVCHRMYRQKDYLFFSKSFHTKEIETCSQLLASLFTLLQHLQTLYSWSIANENKEPSLFASEDHGPQELLNQAEAVNQYCFYGRSIGFQFCSSMQVILRTISICMAAFSESFFSKGNMLERWGNSFKYVSDPEAKARCLVNISQNADISFCKAFWLLNESGIAQIYPSIVMPTLAINQIISIPPEEINLITLENNTISIPIPTSHIGKKPIHVRLMSAKRRIGMVGSGSAAGRLENQSEILVVHCHGGGFVSQSSKSHEVYLRNWAVSLDVPILSIDYSLAPEAPFPRALEEILYTYAWVLNHSSTLLGSTAQKIIFIGDSAGANLMLGTTLKCFELNIRRPDGIFMAYVPVWVEFIPSPARLLCLTDPLLPFGFMMRCLKAYALGNTKKSQMETDENEESSKSDTESFAEVSESDLIALALSPNGDEDGPKLASLPSDSTLNSVSLADVDGAQASELPEEKAKSQEYIQKFLNLYKNSNLRTSFPMLNGSKGKDSEGSTSSKSWSLFGWNSKKSDDDKMDNSGERSPLDEFVFSVPRHPLLSPYLASESVLSKFPPVKILTVEFDPCLDDCVMFAKKLLKLGNSITLDILPGLPHGFLNLSLISKEAADGSELCVKRIQELISMAQGSS